MKILVIEDEPEMRRNLVSILRLEKFEPIAAENGRAGVAAARQEKTRSHPLRRDDARPRWLRCPGRVRADVASAATPFIFLTAKGEKPDIRTGMNLGADDYLTKPVGQSLICSPPFARVLSAPSSRIKPEFKPNFSSAKPLETALDLTPRVAEVLLWLAQGKTNGEIAVISATARPR
jgi:DNA-binding NarL/FixJ family response regulator